ncbi:MAG: hypothetical protein N3G75_06300 [Methanothrix sp.]|nr:hypothetical protein [Methanothrix sp.]MCX8207426.1 hypothetical protein [Methanothrix sp.]
MVKVTLPNDQFLNPDFVETKVLELLKPKLIWLPYLARVEVDAKGIRYRKEKASPAGDPEMRAPRPVTPGAKFPTVSISQLEEDAARIGRRGFEVRISEDAREAPEGIDEIARAYERVAFYLAMAVNMDIGQTLYADVRQASSIPNFQFPIGDPWSDPEDAKPIEDLLALAGAMEQAYMPYQLTDVFVHLENYRELARYLLNLNVDQDAKEQMWGVPSFTEDNIKIPVLGLTVHRVPKDAAAIGGIQEGKILGLDRNFPAATYYYTRSKVYESRTENDIGFSLHHYTDDETHDEVFQMWVDYVVVVKEPGAGIAASGI